MNRRHIVDRELLTIGVAAMAYAGVRTWVMHAFMGQLLRRCLLLLALAVALCILQTRAYSRDVAGVSGDFASKARALEMLSAQVKSNYGRMSTWSGRYDVTEQLLIRGLYAEELAKSGGQSGAGPFLQRGAARVIFTVDFNTDSLFTFFESVSAPEITYAVDGSGLTLDTVPTSHTSIRTSEHYLYALNTDMRESHRVAFRDVASKAAKDEWSTVVDPRTFFGHGGFKFWDLFTFYRTWPTQVPASIREVVERAVSVEERVGAGGVPTYVVLARISRRGGGHDVAEFTCDGSVGFNVTKLRFEKVLGNGTARKTQDQNREYKLSNGIYIPSLIHSKEYAPDGKQVFERTLTLTESTLNGPVPADKFSVRSLGIDEGDWLIDRIENVELRFDGKQLVPATSFLPVENRPRRWWPVFLGVQAFLMLVWGLLSIRRRAMR